MATWKPRAHRTSCDRLDRSSVQEDASAPSFGTRFPPSPPPVLISAEPGVRVLSGPGVRDIGVGPQAWADVRTRVRRSSAFHSPSS